ncbi:hypothetical protein FOQG_16403 [Fusarium oxysporum f. sp. raphani 54005]|uniref:Uncharacterized protein n=2 Tax=Fusarium oxysporum f. sp. raphani TaxID=96318 RepID=X0B9X5_FUSOX|nr:hypothetical protein FOQG_16403 [Fusarium oxysporum f. sp. raphani 54005]
MRSSKMQRLKRLLQKKRTNKDHEMLTQMPSATPPASTSSKTVCLSRLEGLPFEIRNGILLAVDAIADLSALVHASPTFHQQYRLDRAFWLWHCLHLELGQIYVDAYIADQCNMPEFRLRRNREKILLFIEDYKSHRFEITDISTKPPDEYEILSMAFFHSSVIRPLMKHYVAWARANLEGLTSPNEISRTEERRITRGLYRFQIFCNLFGPAKGYDSYCSDRVLREEERLRLFLDQYTAWEVEEILCINTFIHAKYRIVFEQVQWDLHPDNPSFDNVRTGPHTPPGAFRLFFKDSPSESHIYGIISRGLSVLSTALETQNHSKLVELVSSEIVLVVVDILFASTNPYHQETRRENQHSDRDQAQDDREKMVFSGDSYDSPPLAWVVFWKEAYSNLFGDFIPRPLRQWGYVMWDSDRLANTNAVAILDQEWKAMYKRPNYEEEPEDPRDEMLAYH